MYKGTNLLVKYKDACNSPISLPPRYYSLQIYCNGVILLRGWKIVFQISSVRAIYFQRQLSSEKFMFCSTESLFLMLYVIIFVVINVVKLSNFSGIRLKRLLEKQVINLENCERPHKLNQADLYDFICNLNQLQLWLKGMCLNLFYKFFIGYF